MRHNCQSTAVKLVEGGELQENPPTFDERSTWNQKTWFRVSRETNRHCWKGRYIGKRRGLSKNPGFTISQGSNSTLSHEVLPLILKIQQCSYQHECQFLHTRSIHNNLNCAFAFFSTMSRGPVFSWNLFAQRPSAGLKTRLWQPTGGSHSYVFFFNGLITGFWKLEFFSKFKNTGLGRGKYPISTGTCWGPHVFNIPRAQELHAKKLNKLYTGCPICHLPASKQKGLNSNKRLHFPTRRSKARIHIGFQVPKAAAFYANPEPWPYPFIDISWLVNLDLWFLLHFMVSCYVCKLST